MLSGEDSFGEELQQQQLDPEEVNMVQRGYTLELADALQARW